jgi:apolipoprotein N-acyltransferase
MIYLLKTISLIKFSILGAGMALVLPTTNFPPYIVLVLLIPLIRFQECASHLERFTSGLFFGLGYFLLLLKWMVVVGNDAWFALSILCAIWWAIAGLVSTSFVGSRFWPLWFATSWTALEILRDRFPWGGFGWGQIGTIWLETPFSGLYATLGQIGMTFLTYLAIAVVYVVTLNIRQFNTLKLTGYVSIVISLSLGASWLSLNKQPINRDVRQTIEISAIQGGVEHTGLGVLGQPYAVLNKHIAETQKYLAEINQSDLLVWPESSVDLDPYKDSLTPQSLFALDAEVSPPVLIGSTLRSESGLRQNVSQILQSSSITSVYQKRHLVPFGEFLPLRDLVSKYTERASMLATDYEPGKYSGDLEVAGINAAILICFEIADDSLIHENIANQSVVIVQTNNATYQHLGQSEQQLIYARIRAIETQRPVISVSTSGISAVINPKGQIVDSILQDDTGLLNSTITKVTGETIATKLHDALLILIFATFAGGLVLMVQKRFRLKS